MQMGSAPKPSVFGTSVEIQQLHILKRAEEAAQSPRKEQAGKE